MVKQGRVKQSILIKEVISFNIVHMDVIQFDNVDFTGTGQVHIRNILIWLSSLLLLISSIAIVIMLTCIPRKKEQNAFKKMYLTAMNSWTWRGPVASHRLLREAKET